MQTWENVSSEISALLILARTCFVSDYNIFTIITSLAPLTVLPTNTPSKVQLLSKRALVSVMDNWTQFVVCAVVASFCIQVRNFHEI
jgi:hypothetical protein